MATAEHYSRQIERVKSKTQAVKRQPPSFQDTGERLVAELEQRFAPHDHDMREVLVAMRRFYDKESQGYGLPEPLHKGFPGCYATLDRDRLQADITAAMGRKD